MRFRLTLLQRWMRLLLVLLVFAASPAAATETRITPEMVSAALEAQGYTIASNTRTLLGRVRFVASKGLIWREVVLDLSTGQILRDYAVEFSPAEAPRADSTDMPRGGRVIEDTVSPGAGG
ncbi:hypothetical protein [Natronohydrobacter thiooxidans]|uniref:hypothetical protein n=1 Tax=Natronohydrobacter thiooxidans TaxID=87172 RepID=UPI0008FF793A|nr:hypothetical protein [Natronohydrobacter thiooxidans]